jgi:hypothetical protein
MAGPVAKTFSTAQRSAKWTNRSKKRITFHDAQLGHRLGNGGFALLSGGVNAEDGGTMQWSDDGEMERRASGSGKTPAEQNHLGWQTVGRHR